MTSHNYDNDPLGINSLSGLGLNGSQFHCDICGQDVTRQTVRVRCAECRDFDLCLKCFSVREEKDDHLWTHKYIVIGGRILPLINSEWSAVEEFILVEGVSRVGLGNWNDVADSIALGSSPLGAPKKMVDCERHYNDYYLDRSGSVPQIQDLYLPSTIPPIGGLNTVFTRRKPKSVAEGPRGWIGIDHDNKKIISEREARFSNEDPNDLSPLIKTKEELHDEPIPPQSLTVRLASAATDRPQHDSMDEVIPGSHIQGSLPLRNELEHEYDPEAENMIADLSFTTNESPIEIDLKLMCVALYNARLDERCRRKDNLLSKSSLDLRRHKHFAHCRTQEDRELALLTFPLGQYISEAEHEQFIQLLMEERQANVRLAYLREWLMNGLISLDDVQKYENEVYQLQCTKAVGPERHYGGGSMDIFTPEEQKLVKYWEARADVKCADRLNNQGTAMTGKDIRPVIKKGGTSVTKESVFSQFSKSILDYGNEDKVDQNQEESQQKTVDNIPLTSMNFNSITSPISLHLKPEIPGVSIPPGIDNNVVSGGVPSLLKHESEEVATSPPRLSNEGSKFLNEVEKSFCESLDITPLQFLLLRVVVSKESTKWSDVKADPAGFLRKLNIKEGKLDKFVDSMIVLPKPASANDQGSTKNSDAAHRRPRPNGYRKKTSRLPPLEPRIKLNTTTS